MPKFKVGQMVLQKGCEYDGPGIIVKELQPIMMGKKKIFYFSIYWLPQACYSNMNDAAIVRAKNK